MGSFTDGLAGDSYAIQRAEKAVQSQATSNMEYI
jgi:hypothetical protein